MKYCAKCLQPDTRPNTVFNKDGICPACSYHDTLSAIDWDERKKEIDEVVSFGKKRIQIQDMTVLLEYRAERIRLDKHYL